MLLMGEGLSTGGTASSDVYVNNAEDYVTLLAQGDWGSPEATLILHAAPASDGTFVAIKQDNADLELSSGHNMLGLTIPGGVYFKVVATGGTDDSLNVYVGGNSVHKVE